MKKMQKAAAVRYSRSVPAPLLVARGSGRTAEAIVRKAREHAVTVVENSVLAEGLAVLDVGSFVPEEYWELIASVLVTIRKVWL